MVRFLLVALALAAAGRAAGAELATERYAPAQLAVGQQMLERAQAAAARGDTRLAGRLAWQAGLDARLAWRMSESEALRSDAAELGGAARALIHDLAADNPR
jgi:hypothetical protein